jgi:hypothetical protein
LQLGGQPFSQETQKYHAKSLRVLQQRYADVADKTALDVILRDTSCVNWLQA